MALQLSHYNRIKNKNQTKQNETAKKENESKVLLQFGLVSLSSNV